MLNETNNCSLQSFLTRKTMYVTVAVTLNIFFFVYVHWRCIANNLKKTNKISTLFPPGKISADAHASYYDKVYELL